MSTGGVVRKQTVANIFWPPGPQDPADGSTKRKSVMARFRISWFSIGGHSAAVLLLNDDNFFCILFPPLSFSLVCGEHSANSRFLVGEIPEICLRGRLLGPQSAAKVSPSPGVSHLHRRRGQSTATFADMPRNPSPSRLRVHFARQIMEMPASLDPESDAVSISPRLPPGGYGSLGNFAETLNFDLHSNARKPKNAWT